jgi:hypothetical protein
MDSLKSALGHVTLNLCFPPRASGAGNVNTLFFMLRLAWWGLHKKCARTCCAEHVMHSDASGA